MTLTQFARHCTTNDQQIRTRLQKREQAVKKTDEARKGAASKTPPRPNKPLDGEKPANSRLPTVKNELKCYNCFEPGHIARDCPKPKTERTKQVLATKLAALSPRMEAETENEEP